MIRQTVLGFKLEKTEEALTAHGGLALMAEFNHAHKKNRNLAILL